MEVLHTFSHTDTDFEPAVVTKVKKYFLGKKFWYDKYPDHVLFMYDRNLEDNYGLTIFDIVYGMAYGDETLPLPVPHEIDVRDIEPQETFDYYINNANVVKYWVNTNFQIRLTDFEENWNIHQSPDGDLLLCILMENEHEDIVLLTRQINVLITPKQDTPNVPQD